jgi:hypothetical protein
MQTRELNRATIGVANRTDRSGRATADETNRGLRIGKTKKLRRTACATFVRALMVMCLLVSLAPVSGRAGNERDRDMDHGRENNDKGIRAEIAAVQAQVTSLQSTVSALQTANTNLRNEINNLQTSNARLQNEVSSLKASNTGLQTQLAAVQSNHVLKLGPFVTVDPHLEIGVIGPNITFTGANIHIVSGSGKTNDAPGLGNSIIGYDEDPKDYFAGGPGGAFRSVQATVGGHTIW